MTVELDALDRQRERWRRVRRAMCLDDIADDQFARGGLGARVERLTARIAIVPADPEAHRIEFDDEFWKLWMMDLKGPFPDRALGWGSSASATAFAAARRDGGREDRWGRYAPVDHAGVLDLGLADEAGWRGERNGWKGCCYLLPIVAAVWEACHVYRQVAARFHLEWPWEVTVALPSTAGTVLGRFASGWAEPGHWRYEAPLCTEPHLLLRREAFESPEDWPRSVAFSIGVQIENAFGSRDQRFRTMTNEQLGDFDFAKWR